jgi:hypothetical protein
MRWRARRATTARAPDPETSGESNPQIAPDQGIRTGTPKRPNRAPQTPSQGTVKHVVDLGGAYYNPKPQVEALEKLLRELPDPGAPLPHPPSGGNQDVYDTSNRTTSRNSSPVTRPERLCTNWATSSESTAKQSAGHYDATTFRCDEPACDPTKSTRLHDSTRRAGPQLKSPNT